MAIQRTDSVVEDLGGSNSISLNYNNTSFYSILFVSFYFQDDNNTPETLTVTCDGTPMTLAITQVMGGSPIKGQYIYYIVGNARGTNVISLSAPAGLFYYVKCVGYKNVAQTSSINATYIINK